MKTIPVLLAIGVLIAGCGRAPVAKATEGNRAQRLTEVRQEMQNDFVGVWSSPPSQTVNDWLVIFTSDGSVAVDGPGLKADGSYRAEGQRARASFTVMNGIRPSGEDANVAEFAILDGQQMMFSTGIPGEAPVQLVRSVSGVASAPQPSIRTTATGVPVDALTLMMLSL